MEKHRVLRVAGIAVGSLLLVTVLSPRMALAGGPAAGSDSGASDPGYVPLTPAQEQLVSLKFQEAAVQQAAAEQWLAANSGQSQSGSGMQPTMPIPPGGGPGGVVTTYARAQASSIYCGPAAVQVVSNYAWGMSSGSDKWSQWYISSHWTYTDTYGQTYVYRERIGLNSASAGHLPANFVYAEYQPTNGSDWYNKLITDVSSFSMPQVANLAPHDPGASNWLHSWPVPTSGPAGHYITLYGWSQYWNGTSGPTVYYDDSAGDGGYGAGAYMDPALTVWGTIYNHTDWVIW
jgi:hypothetical protein